MGADDIFSDLAPAKRKSAGASPSPADALFADLSPGANTPAGSNAADALFEDLRPPAPTRNTFARANDTVIEAANAAAGLVKAGSDLIAPGNRVSRGIDDFIEAGQERQSDFKQDQRRRLAQDLEAAPSELAKAGTYLRHAVKEDPLGTVGQALGNIGPFAALGKAVQGASLAMRTGVTMGAAGGVAAGEVRGNIHERITSTPDAQLQESSPEYAELRRTLPEAEAKERIASSFERHAPEILATGAFGALGGRYGLEGMAARVAPNRGRIAGAVIGVADEASQGAFEQLASNYGIRRTLPDQRLDEDVALNAAAEGILGLAGGIAATPRRNAVPPEMADFAPAPLSAPAPLPSEALGIDPAAGPISRAAAKSIDQAPRPIDDPVAVGVIPDVEPTPDFGPFKTAVEGQFPVPLEAAQRLAALMAEHGRNPVIVPNIDETGFGVAHAESLTPEQRAAVSRFQPTPVPESESFGTPRQAPLSPLEKTRDERIDPEAVTAQREQVAQQMAAIEAIAAARRDSDDATGLPSRGGHSVEGRDTLLDWMTEAERNQFEALRRQLPSSGAEAAAARARLARKHERRQTQPEQTIQPLDHGELNIPGRTSTIDRDLDRFKHEQARSKKAANKEEAAQRKADRAQAKDLFERYGERIVERHGARFGHKELRAELKRMAAWQPRRFIDLVAQFRSETASGQLERAKSRGKPFAVTRADGSTFGAYSDRRDAEGALERAGTGARIIDTTVQPTDTLPQETLPQETQRDEQADPYDSIETRPGTTEAQREAGRSALQAIVRRLNVRAARRWGDHTDRAAITLLGARLTAGFRANGGNRLVGQKVDGAEALATLAQVYRDPRFETFRVFYTKGDTVVGEAGYSNRLPAAVYVPPNLTQDIERDLKGFEADGYFILHNHPSGRSRPSGADIKLTREVAQLVPGMRAHVVIDSDEYSTITPAGSTHTIPAPQFDAVDFTATPEIESELLGTKIRRAADVALIGSILKNSDNHATAIFTRRDGTVQLIADVPLGYFRDRSKRAVLKLQAAVRRLARAAGAGGSRFLVLPDGHDASDFAGFMRRGVFRDIVRPDGTALSEAGVVAGRDFLDKRTRNAFRVSDDGAIDTGSPTTGRLTTGTGSPYDADALQAPPRLTPKDWAAHALARHRSWALGALTRDQITDIFGRAMPGVAQFDKVVQEMDAVRQRIAEKSDALLERWRKLPAMFSDRMSDVMHRATLAEFDPDRHKGNTPSGEQGEILRLWASLPEDAKALYRDVRDQYSQTLMSIRDGLADRAETASTNGARVAAQIRLDFDKYLQQGPYFPLARFGDLLLIADKEGERIVESFESSARREARLRQLRGAGWTVKTTSKREYSATRDGAAGKFIGDVIEKINALDMPIGQKSNLLDNLNQLAISTLPDASYRRHFRHRKGVPGFSSDAMRAFAASMQHAGHHIAKIRHAHELSFLLDEMQKDVSDVRGDVDTTAKQQVINELSRRLDYMMNPNTHPVAAAAGQVGFVMSLGGSVASGLVNATQTPFVTLPFLGAKYGFGKAAAALTKASRDYFGGKWEKWSGFVVAGNHRLNEGERNALRQLEHAGLINLTQAHDLAGTANTDSTVSQRAWAMNRAMRIVGWTFHLPEVFNRQVTALAAYRLAAESGMEQADAVEYARQAIIRTHFDYSASNRARFMQGNFTRVITMFKQYSQQMTYLIWRNAYLALKDESPEVRREARRMLLGVSAMHFTAAGSLGLPLGLFGISPLLTLLSMGMGDEDEPWDWETEYRKMLADVFGKEAGEAIAHGPARMLLSVDLASRVGLGDMWIRAPFKEAEGRDLVEAWMMTLLGPVAGYVGQMGTAAMAFEEGKFARGVEAMMPKFVSAPLKAYRFSDEGVRSWRGDDLGIDLTPAEIVGTALGFQPARLAEMYEGRAAVKGREKHLQNRRSEILNMWIAANMAGDRDAQMEAVQAARRFSMQNPDFGITGDTFRQAYRAKLRNAAQIREGIFLTRKREGLREEGRFANVQ